jgi:GNAT superfamily N-acetyltransferase
MPRDAVFCFKTRSNAFIQKFYGELSPEAVAAGVNAYMPKDYIRMAKKMEFFIVEENSIPVGFFTIKRVDAITAEIPLIYIDLNHLGKGIGTACIHFIKKWLSSNWIDVGTLIVDTVIPEYNGGFYQRLGFIPIEETFCDFPDQKVKALRLCKELNS